MSDNIKSSILSDIVNDTRRRVAQEKELTPIKRLEKSIHFQAPVVSLKRYLARPDLDGIIAEFKRRSPSKGDFNLALNVAEVSLGYMQSGASALSILTEPNFFSGDLEDLKKARQYNYCPILRKDFIVDEYQLFEARAAGADVVLLIAACLSPATVKQFTATAHSLGMEVLLEIHEEKELDCCLDEVDVVGINNRDLKSFQTDLRRSFSLREKLPKSRCVISESGISKPDAVFELWRHGFSGFLIGEHFMAQPDPIMACRKFIKDLKSLKKSDIVNCNA